MRRAGAIAVVVGIAAPGCQPVLYDLVESAGNASTSSSGETTESGEATSGTPPPSHCQDGGLDGDESDVDCGGPSCSPCASGQRCVAPADCWTGLCVEGECRAPQCQFAEDCPPEPCRAGECDPSTHQCVYVDFDGVPCDDGDPCTEKDLCLDGACGGFARECGQLDGACQIGFCNPQTGNCGVEFVDGAPCDDGQACTVSDMCWQGSCLGKPNQPPLFVDFSQPQGWQMDELWEIGPAKPSACAQIGADDPEEDHTLGPGGWLAGLRIGDCLPDMPLPMDVCLTSPPMDVLPEEPLLLTYWSRLSAPPDPARAYVEVWNGQQWFPIFDTNGEPVDEPEWTQHAYDVMPFMSKDFRVRFCHHQPIGGGPLVAGWSVDDVALVPPGCGP